MALNRDSTDRVPVFSHSKYDNLAFKTLVGGGTATEPDTPAYHVFANANSFLDAMPTPAPSNLYGDYSCITPGNDIDAFMKAEYRR